MQLFLTLYLGQTRHELNLIKTGRIEVFYNMNLLLFNLVIRMHTQFFACSRQPIKSAIIHLFPYLCEIESIEMNDEAFVENLKMSRLNVGLSYLNADYTEALIQQLSEVEYIDYTQSFAYRVI